MTSSTPTISLDSTPVPRSKTSSDPTESSKLTPPPDSTTPSNAKASPDPTTSSDAPTPPRAKKRYRHIEQSEGEILTLPGSLNEITYTAVGTFRCETCLCLYIEFKDKSVFIVHINAQTDTPKRDPEASPLGKQAREKMYKGQWMSDPERGGKLRSFVLQQLRSLLGEERSKQATKGFVVCPAIRRHWGQHRANGWWIRAAIQEFFSDIDVEFHKGHGFVAAPGMEAEFFGWEGLSGYEENLSGQEDSSSEEEESSSGEEDDPVRIPPETYGWESCDQPLMQQTDVATMELGKWWFLYRGDKWEIET